MSDDKQRSPHPGSRTPPDPNGEVLAANLPRILSYADAISRVLDERALLTPTQIDERLRTIQTTKSFDQQSVHAVEELKLHRAQVETLGRIADVQASDELLNEQKNLTRETKWLARYTLAMAVSTFALAVAAFLSIDW